ncbi:MAG: HEPN domain-containing protein [Candidatus Cloacimonetes bacterium]|nr:HEPN domain-containing protein [Candidatus Cloacimonadota bacterium]
MSIAKRETDALRWLNSAKSDLETGELLQQHGKYSHSCFLYQQAAEKAVKALHISYDCDVWGHSIQKLMEDFLSINSELHQLLSRYINSARVLDRLYIPTRYPDGLPDLTPEAAFSSEDAQDAYERSNAIVAFVTGKIKLSTTGQ